MARKKPSKPPAEDRTIDLFTKKTPLEEAEEVLRMQSNEDCPEAERAASPAIEDNIEHYREQAFKVQEWTSKYFGTVDVSPNQELVVSNTTLPDIRCSTNETNFNQTEVIKPPHSHFRLTKRNGWLYLEQTRSVKPGDASYHYAGVMFPEDALEDLAQVFQQALLSAKDVT